MTIRGTPRRRAAKASDVDPMIGGLSSHEEVARRAYEIFLNRGGGHGRDFDDWLEAEREVGARAARRES